MKTGTILDLDMTALGQHLGSFWQWWVSEISAMLPRNLQLSARRVSGPIADWHDDDSTLWFDGQNCADEDCRSPSSATIAIPAERVLIRTLEMPAVSLTDIRKMVMLDLDRLMPFPTDSAYADASFEGEPSTSGRRHVQIAAVPKAFVRSIASAAISFGVNPTALGVLEGDFVKFDFLASMRDDGSVPKRGAERGLWWSLLAILFAFNLGLFVYLDMQSVVRLNDLVESQSLSAAGARKIAGRIAAEDKLRAEILTLRDRSDALGQLARTTRELPEGVWVQRYSASADLLRVAGYQKAGVDLLGALRKSGRYASIRASTSDGALESGAGQPFDITAEIKIK